MCNAKFIQKPILRKLEMHDQKINTYINLYLWTILFKFNL